MINDILPTPRIDITRWLTLGRGGRTRLAQLLRWSRREILLGVTPRTASYTCRACGWLLGEEL
jgi:hypothetical protein